jgi:UDP-N-acetylmuramoyl-L-alanine---L-glutamate ligase
MMTVKELQQYALDGNQIALIGYGKEIQGFLVWLLETASIPAKAIRIADQREIYFPDEISEKDQSELKKHMHVGFQYLDVLLIDSVKLAFKAPGMHSLKTELVAFRDKHGSASIQSSMVFFIAHFRKQIIAITGTKGKTTTSLITEHILNHLGDTYSAQYCGNTSNISPFAFWTDLNQRIEKNHYFVIELSSYQLQDLAYSKLSPARSMITNLYIDHQDQHVSPEEYWYAKETIFLFQKPNDLFVCTEQVSSISQSKKPGKYIVVSNHMAQSISKHLKSPLRGGHNELNLGVSLCCIADILNPEKQVNEVIETNKQQLQTALADFKTPELRQEIIKSITLSNNTHIVFVNDGAASELTATGEAIKTFTQRKDEAIWLFVNGRDKGTQTDEFARLAAKHERHIIEVSASGAIGKKLEYEGIVQDTSPTLLESLPTDLHAIQKKWSAWSEKGFKTLYVILSPGGSSFDEYKNYKYRADAWNKWVKNITKDY